MGYKKMSLLGWAFLLYTYYHLKKFLSVHILQNLVIRFLNKSYINLNYPLLWICKSVLYLHTSNFQHQYNVTWAKFVFALWVLNSFPVVPELSLILWVGPSPILKYYFFGYQYEMMTNINTKPYNISSIVIIKTPYTFSIKCYSLTIVGKFTFDCVFY